jgi:hypothetical protein
MIRGGRDAFAALASVTSVTQQEMKKAATHFGQRPFS